MFLPSEFSFLFFKMLFSNFSICIKKKRNEIQSMASFLCLLCFLPWVLQMPPFFVFLQFSLPVDCSFPSCFWQERGHMYADRGRLDSPIYSLNSTRLWDIFCQHLQQGLPWHEFSGGSVCKSKGETLSMENKNGNKLKTEKRRRRKKA